MIPQWRKYLSSKKSESLNFVQTFQKYLFIISVILKWWDECISFHAMYICLKMTTVCWWLVQLLCKLILSSLWMILYCCFVPFLFNYIILFGFKNIVCGFFGGLIVYRVFQNCKAIYSKTWTNLKYQLYSVPRKDKSNTKWSLG